MPGMRRECKGPEKNVLLFLCALSLSGLWRRAEQAPKLKCGMCAKMVRGEIWGGKGSGAEEEVLLCLCVPCHSPGGLLEWHRRRN